MKRNILYIYTVGSNKKTFLLGGNPCAHIKFHSLSLEKKNHHPLIANFFSGFLLNDKGG